MAGEKLAHERLEIMKMVEQRTGLPVHLEEDISLIERGLWKMSDRNDCHHVVKFNPRYRNHLHHIITHEAGHILRFYESAPDERMIPCSTKKHKDLAISQLSGDFEEMIEKGIPPGFIIDSFDLFYGGLIRQLTSIPTDMRIEEWMADSYPWLHHVQEDALKSQVKESHAVMKPEIEELTPRTVYRASNSMNSAYAEFVSEMFGDRELSLPYQNTIYEATGRQLLNYIKGKKDRGYAGDRDAINAWARILSLEDWFGWIPYNRIENNFIR